MDGGCSLVRKTMMNQFRAIVLDKADELKHRLSPFILTFCKTDMSSIDILSLIEAGLSIVRFKMWIVSEHNIMQLMKMLKEAIRLNCEKYNISTWPVALSVDIPNACIRTGTLGRDKITNKQPTEVFIEDNSIIEVTCNDNFMSECDSERIYIDDPYTFQAIKVGTEMSVASGRIVMVCIEVIDAETVKCEVLRGDFLSEQLFFCIRGVKHTKPPLSKSDLDLIEFAKDHKVDIITINSLRRPEILVKVRKMLKNVPNPPLLLASICEQEGLDNIDEIIKVADGIILAREFLAYEIVDILKMTSIELNVCAKCKQVGKPIFISGNILETTLQNGKLNECDIADVSNAVIRGCGFLFRGYNTTKHVVKAMHLMNNICQTVETVEMESERWRLLDEYKIPVNAAEGCILSCALAMKATDSRVCVVLSVTGKTAKQLSHMMPGIIVLTITTNAAIARQLRIYRGIVPIVYTEEPKKNWFHEMNARIVFAAEFGIKYDILEYGDTYVALKRSHQYSSYCDSVSIWNVTQTRKAHTCPE